MPTLRSAAQYFYKARKAAFCTAILIFAILDSPCFSQKPVTPIPSSYAVISGRTFDPSERLAVPDSGGRIWYVDGTNGRDSNDGRSAGTAFKTIGKALDRYGPLAAGDTVKIKAGLYREYVEINKPGTASNRITIGPYGDGEVIIDASRAVTGWTQVSGQIYKATPGFVPSAVVVDAVPLFPEFNQGALVEGRWYYNSSTGELFLCCPTGGNPSAHDVGVIADNEYATALFVNASYVTLYGLAVRFSGGHGISVLGNYVRIEKSKLLFNGKSGANFYAYNEISSTNGEVIKCYSYYNVMRNWPRGKYKWGGWAPSLSSNGTPNISYIGNIVHKSGGEGILAYTGSGGTVMQDNVVLDSWSVNIYIDNQPNGTITNNFSLCSIPNTQDLYNNGDADPTDNRNVRRLRAEGIMTADENYGGGATLNNILIANNVIINCRRGINHYAQASGSGLKHVSVLNNTIIVPQTLNKYESDISGIAIPHNNGNNIGSFYRNNIVYASNPATYILHGGTAAFDNFLGLTLDHNLWYHTSKADAFHWGSDYTFAQWRSLSGTSHGTGDVNADPKMHNPASTALTGMKLQNNSPAIDAGINAGIAIDFDRASRPKGNACDLGAYEYNSTPSAPILHLK